MKQENENIIEVEAEENEVLEAEEIEETTEKKEGFFKSMGKKIWSHRKGIAAGVLAFVGGVVVKSLIDSAKSTGNEVEDDLALPDYSDSYADGNNSVEVEEENIEEEAV